MIAGLDHDGAAGWWSPLPQPQVLEDSLAHGRVLDDRDQPHLAAAPSADQNVLPPHAPEQLGPRETASAPRVVRADEVGVGRVVVLVLLLVLLRINNCPGSVYEPSLSTDFRRGVTVIPI